MTDTPQTQRTFLIGTRGSTLARTQTGHVQAGIHAAGFHTELHIVHTPGDASQASQIPVATIGVGVFTETLRTALANGECDIAVHSMKDLPTAPDPRFITVVPERADNREVLVSLGNTPLAELPHGAMVGTSAPRRVSQLRGIRPDLDIRPLRGNIDSRMGRVRPATGNPTADETRLDAVILARAGLERVGMLHRAAESIDRDVIMPAPAQGALSIEVRADDREAIAAVQHLDHAPSHFAALAERAVLSTLEAGCSAPVAAYSEWDDGQLTVHGGVYALDGTARLVKTMTFPGLGDTQAARHAGAEVGKALLAAGAADFI